jgi:hypothetical protein
VSEPAPEKLHDSQTVSRRRKAGLDLFDELPEGALGISLRPLERTVSLFALARFVLTIIYNKLPSSAALAGRGIAHVVRRDHAENRFFAIAAYGDGSMNTPADCVRRKTTGEVRPYDHAA